MTWFPLVLGLLPIVLFVVGDLAAGMRAGASVAIVAALAELVFSYFYFGELDGASVGTAVLVVLLGAVTLYMDHPLYLKLQPAVVAAVLGLFLVYFQVAGEPYLVQMVPKLSAFMGEEQRWALTQPETLGRLRRLGWWMGATFLIQGAVLATLARSARAHGSWLAVRLAIYPAVLGVMVLDRWFFPGP